MRKSLFLAPFTLLFTSCSEQNTKSKEAKVYYDTLRLLEPKTDKEEIASALDYRHSIDLTKDRYVITINGVKNQKANFQELSAFLKKNRKQIIKQKISIISGSQTSYEQIVAILDLLNDQHIKDYKLISSDGSIPATSPVIVQRTKPVKQKLDITDSTVLTILILESSFETSFLKKTTVHSQISELEKFIVSNRNHINPDKIVVNGASKLPYKAFRPVTSLLAKHGFLGYQITVKD